MKILFKSNNKKSIKNEINQVATYKNDIFYKQNYISVLSIQKLYMLNALIYISH